MYGFLKAYVCFIRKRALGLAAMASAACLKIWGIREPTTLQLGALPSALGQRRWLTSDEEAFSQPFTQPVVVPGRERTARKQRTALFSIGACGTPACADGSLAGEYCPCGGGDGIDPSAAAAHAINTRARAGMPLMLAVSRSCACIGSPCLKHCVHGASTGTSGVVG